MKAKEFVELKEKSLSELDTNLNDMKSKLFTLRFQLATGQLQNTASINACKRDIARVKTIIRQRQNQKQA